MGLSTIYKWLWNQSKKSNEVIDQTEAEKRLKDAVEKVDNDTVIICERSIETSEQIFAKMLLLSYIIFSTFFFFYSRKILSSF